MFEVRYILVRKISVEKSVDVLMGGDEEETRYNASISFVYE